MGLNISFKGSVYDENDNAIDCKYQVHYVTQNVWNDVRDTDTEYYSANAGDSDSLSQDGKLDAGDIVLVCFWQGDGNGGATPDNRDSLFDRFGVYTIVHDGSTSSYVFDVKLMPKVKPTISWYLNNIRTINRDVVAIDNSYDWTKWTYDNKDMFHRQSYYGVSVFPKVDLLTVEYDWGDDNDNVDGYESSNTHQFTAIGDYTVKIHVTDEWTLDDTATIDIRIKYNIPIGLLSFSPDGVSTKIHTTEDDTITADITDEDSRITNIDHHWIVKNRDDGSLISDTLVDSDTTLDYSYTKTIQVLQKHYATQDISWNDGYDDQEFTYSKELIITNWLPLVNMSISYINDKSVKFIPNCSDIDGSIVEYKYELYVLVPFTDQGYTLAKTDVLTTDDTLQVNFDSNGHYKMVLTAKDDVGGKSSFEKEFDITIGAGVCDDISMNNDMFFMFRNIC